MKNPEAAMSFDQQKRQGKEIASFSMKFLILNSCSIFSSSKSTFTIHDEVKGPYYPFFYIRIPYPLQNCELLNLKMCLLTFLRGSLWLCFNSKRGTEIRVKKLLQNLYSFDTIFSVTNLVFCERLQAIRSTMADDKGKINFSFIFRFTQQYLLG